MAVNVYDALLRKRIYRPAFPHDTALVEKLFPCPLSALEKLMCFGSLIW